MGLSVRISWNRVKSQDPEPQARNRAGNDFWMPSDSDIDRQTNIYINYNNYLYVINIMNPTWLTM